MHHKESRATLGGKLSAVLVAAGSSVGLGNIWRFPYVAGENGGGAFLLIYLLFVVIFGTVGLRAPVDYTVVHGRVTVAQGHLMTVDEERLAQEAETCCRQYLAR